MIPAQAFFGHPAIDDYDFSAMRFQGLQKSRPDFCFQQNHQFRPDTGNRRCHNRRFVKRKIANSRLDPILTSSQFRQCLIEKINPLTCIGGQQDLNRLFCLKGF